MAKAGTAPTGEGKTGEAYSTPDAPTPDSAKAGTARAGFAKHGETGRDVQVLEAPLQTWHVTPLAGDISGAGTASLTAPLQPWHVTPLPGDITRVRVLDAPLQSWQTTPLSGDITGQGTVSADAPLQSWHVNPLTGTIGYTEWSLGETTLPVVDATATPQGIDLTIAGRAADLRTLVADLDDYAGLIQVRERADGTYSAAGAAGGSNRYTLFPEVDSQPPRISRPVYVEDISVDWPDSELTATTATISLVWEDSRDAVAYSGPTDDTVWRFDFADGATIDTPRVHTVTGSEETEVQAIFSPAEVEHVETVAAAAAGVVTDRVPDGDDLTRDTTPGSRQTVTITPPDAATDSPINGTYAIAGWETEGVGSGGYRVTLSLRSL